MQRIEILLQTAVETARLDLKLAQRQAQIARRICMKYNVRLPYDKRMLFCKGCKRLIIGGLNARIRLMGRPKAVKITCLECGYVYRKILTAKQV